MDVDEPVTDVEQSETEDKSQSPKGLTLRWNKEGEKKLRGIYGKGSRSTNKRQQKSAMAMEKAASQTPHIGALFQHQLEMASQSTNSVTPVPSLSQLPRGCSAPISKIQQRKKQRLEASRDLTRLLTLVTEQEKK